MGSVCLRVLLVVVVVVLVVPASPSSAAAAAAAAATALLPLASLMRLASLAKPLEVVAVLGGVGVPIVVDAERAIILLLGARGWSCSARLLGVGFSREDRIGLALLRGFLLLGALGGLPRLVFDEQAALFSLGALVRQVEELDDGGDVVVDAQFLEMYAYFVSSTFFDMSHLIASKQFVFADCSGFDRFCLLLAFSLLQVLCGILFWVEELHLRLVTVANV